MEDNRSWVAQTWHVILLVVLIEQTWEKGLVEDNISWGGAGMARDTSCGIDRTNVGQGPRGG